jgi:hypothetical protein
MLLVSRRDAQLFREGFFRGSGEVHRWMYDRFSLPRLLRRCGFADPVQRTYSESAIDPDCSPYGLDADEQGRALKPDRTLSSAPGREPRTAARARDPWRAGRNSVRHLDFHRRRADHS